MCDVGKIAQIGEVSLTGLERQRFIDYQVTTFAGYHCKHTKTNLTSSAGIIDGSPDCAAWRYMRPCYRF